MRLVSVKSHSNLQFSDDLANEACCLDSNFGEMEIPKCSVTLAAFTKICMDSRSLVMR